MLFSALVFSFLEIKVKSVNQNGQNILQSDETKIISQVDDVMKTDLQMVEKIVDKVEKSEKNEKTEKSQNNLKNLKNKEIINLISPNPSTLKSQITIPNPTSSIKEIDTQILIKKDKTEGEVLEKVKFEIKDGVFDTLMRKVSLGGTADRQFGFKLAST
jgi:hypothetical protein